MVKYIVIVELNGESMLKVTAGIIKENGKYLICQRALDDECPTYWEFPGGKLEANETLEECIVRELKEELDITVKVINEFDTTEFSVNGKSIHVTFFCCQVVSGTIKMNVHMDAKWVMASQLKDYKFLPADKDVIERLINIG